MQRPKWFVIAKNEYRIMTSWIRRGRLAFPFVVLGVIITIIMIVAPAIVGLIEDDLIAFMLSNIAVAMMQSILFMFFFYFLMFPISSALRDIDTSQTELLLSSPIKPSDILFGKFMGVLPFYALVMAGIVGFFTALLDPLGMDLLQKVIIISIFILTLSSAAWIGIVLASLVRSRLGRSNKGKDFAKAFSLIIALPFIAIMYSIIGGRLQAALEDPTYGELIKNILDILPSSWGGKIIVDFATHPGNMGPVLNDTLLRLSGLTMFFIFALYFGKLAADRAYSMETTTFTSAWVKKDRFIYRVVRSLGGGGSFGIVLASIFKDYGRRFQNISKIIYIVVIIALIMVLIMDDKDMMGPTILSQFIFPMYAGFVVSEINLRGKEALFIFRKAPGGVDRLIKARLVHGWLLVLPVSIGIISFVYSTVPGAELFDILKYTAMIATICTAYVPFILGINLMNPQYTEKESMFNVMVLPMMGLVVVIGSLVALGDEWAPAGWIGLNWGMGLLLLYLGREKLKRME